MLALCWIFKPVVCKLPGHQFRALWNPRACRSIIFWTMLRQSQHCTFSNNISVNKC